jgi:transposase InsO family protein
MREVVRTLTAADVGILVDHRVLICDRDAKWSETVRERLGDSGIRIVQTPFRAPNANAHAERFVRSIKHECFSRIIPFGARHLRGRADRLGGVLEHYAPASADNSRIHGFEIRQTIPSRR